MSPTEGDENPLPPCLLARSPEVFRDSRVGTHAETCVRRSSLLKNTCPQKCGYGRQEWLRHVIFALLLFLKPLPAQTTTGTMFGVVRDSTGAVVPQAHVTAAHGTTTFSRNAVTDDNGAYLIPNLPIGPYTVSIDKLGLRKFNQSGIRNWDNACRS